MNKHILNCVFGAIAAGVIILSGCAGDGADIPITTGSTNGGTATDGSTSGGQAPYVVATSPARGENPAPTSRRISATFSETMDPASLNQTTFSASTESGPLQGTVSTVGNTATLKFASAMPANTQVTAVITTGVMSRVGTHMTSKHSWRFTTGAAPDVTPPTVSSVDPRNGATGVGINQRISATFSEAMDPETINGSTFRIQAPNGSSVAGTIWLMNNIAIFNPVQSLNPRTTYTATLTTGVQDLSENALAQNYVWSFTTGETPDTTAPRVIATDPEAEATDVPVNKQVSATFSDQMDAATINTNHFTLRNAAGTLIPAVVTYANKVAILDPVNALAPNAVFTARLTNAVKDSTGNPLAAAFVWTFTTGAGGDGTRPRVTSTNPADNATNVFLNRSISATFDKQMQADSINTNTFKVAGINGTVSYDSASRIATFNPNGDLAANTTYTARIETGVRDTTGHRLGNAYTWTFTTGNQRAQTNIDLGAATSYAVLAGSTVTNAGPTVVNGDLGVSPGSAVTGFPPGRVNGTIHAGDAQAAKAKQDLLKGQLEAAGLLGGQALPGDLSGLTFTPGLYKNSTSVMLSSGNVTLDAQGDPDAVFIFQMGTTLTTATGTKVILAGGARAQNIYWSVGSSATLGVNSVFKGIILAEVSITVNNGATNDGTFLTNVGAVTLESNTVSRSRVGKG